MVGRAATPHSVFKRHGLLVFWRGTA